jgi:hypothetical protein
MCLGVVRGKAALSGGEEEQGDSGHNICEKSCADDLSEPNASPRKTGLNAVLLNVAEMWKTKLKVSRSEPNAAKRLRVFRLANAHPGVGEHELRYAEGDHFFRCAETQQSWQPE